MAAPLRGEFIGALDYGHRRSLARILAGTGVGLKGRPFRDVLALLELMKSIERR